MTETSRSPEPTPNRRTFFQFVTAALGAIAAVLFTIPFVGYLAGALGRRRKEYWVKLGPVSKFPLNETHLVTFENPIRQPWDGMTAQTAVYVRYLGANTDKQDLFHVFAVNCTHLGCPVTWFPQSGLFMCPCHGGVYYEDGEHASGPPPRGLYHCVWRVEGGQLEIEAPHLPTLQNTLTGNGDAGKQALQASLRLRGKEERQ